MSFGITSSPSTFMDLMNKVFKPVFDVFVIVFKEEILVYSRSEEDHANHLGRFYKFFVIINCM